MTPVPLDLPLRPPEAAELANLVFSLSERKPLNDDVRGRVASRLAAMRFESLRPYPGSLERDPVHHSTYYMAIDGRNGEHLLLHMAPAAAPTSAIFAKPLLIGRMRLATGPELVLNAVPFGPADYDAIERMANQIDQSFLPRAQASRPAVVSAATAETFQAFRAVFKSSRKNIAAVEMRGESGPEAFYYAAIWAAIRTGWREGYTAGIAIPVQEPDAASVRETIDRAAPLTRFAVDVSALVRTTGKPEARFGEAMAAAERVHELIRQARAARKITRPFDFELSLENAGAPVSAEEAAFCLEALRDRGHAAQLFAPRVDASTDLSALVAASLAAQCTISLRAGSADLRAVAQVTGGRVNLRVEAGADIAETAAELLG